MKKIFILLFIFISSSVYAGGIYIPQIQPLDLGQIYEQTQRTRQNPYTGKQGTVDPYDYTYKPQPINPYGNQERRSIYR